MKAGTLCWPLGLYLPLWHLCPRGGNVYNPRAESSGMETSSLGLPFCSLSKCYRALSTVLRAEIRELSRAETALPMLLSGGKQVHTQVESGGRVLECTRGAEGHGEQEKRDLSSRAGGFLEEVTMQPQAGTKFSSGRASGLLACHCWGQL